MSAKPMAAYFKTQKARMRRGLVPEAMPDAPPAPRVELNDKGTPVVRNGPIQPPMLEDTRQVIPFQTGPSYF